MPQIRGQFCERRQNKATQMEPGMRYREAVLVNPLVAVKKKIQVNRSWTAAMLEIAAQAALSLQEDLQ